MPALIWFGIAHAVRADVAVGAEQLDGVQIRQAVSNTGSWSWLRYGTYR